MGSKWSPSRESTRPPNESTRFVLVGSKRLFAISTSTCYLSGRHLCFSHRSHPGCLGGLMVEAVSEAFSGGNCGCFPLNGFLRDGIVFVAKPIREKSRCKKRICDVPDHAYLLTISFFLPGCIWITPFWEYQDLHLCISPLGCPLCSWDRLVSSGETIEICVFSSIGM